MLKKIRINRFDDPELIAYYFKSRLNWMPFGHDTKSWFVNWAEGLKNDQSYHKSNRHGERIIPPDNVLFYKDRLMLQTKPVVPIDMGTHLFGFKSACLVGLQEMNKFNIVLDLKFGCTPETTDAIWGLTPVHLVDGKEVILPEWDMFETNTPGHAQVLSQSLLTGTGYPAKVRWSRKHSINKVVGRQNYQLIKNRWCEVTTHPLFSFHFSSDDPMYLIIWNTVQAHHTPDLSKYFKPELEIYNIEIDYE